MAFKKIKLNQKIKKAVLAMGSSTKNMICFARDNLAYLGPLRSDLNAPEDFSGFERDVKRFLKKNPKIIAYDLHPEYQSTKYALALPSTYRLLPIQHHHAHIASCMADNGLKNQKVIGVAFDGTGLGLNNTLWGAEFLVCDYKNFQRKAHLREIPLLGGEKAILEPMRVAAVWLYLLYKDRFLNLDINFVKSIDRKKWGLLKKIYSTRFNSPLSNSMGRLFDAVASLVFAKYQVNFEAELAIMLEKTAASCSLNPTKGYNFKIIRKAEEYMIDPLLVFKEIVSDLRCKEAQEIIAYRFHLTVAQMIKKVCSVLRRENRINKVALSGGVFQNKLLLRMSSDLLYKEGFEVFTHKELSCNDSGISLGQALIANFRS